MAASARAQVYSRAQVINLPTFKTTGEYVGMQGRYMKCILDGTPVVVQFLPDKSKVKVTGTATPDFLAPGLYVKFRGTFDRHGKATEPIKDVVLFSPDANDQLGATEDGGGNAFDAPSPTKKKGPLPPTMAYAITGRITTVHKNQILVNCGNMKVKAEIAPDATVKLDTSDPSWASSGDKVTISGAKLGGGRVIGVEVSIELAKPLQSKNKLHGNHVVEKTVDKSADKVAKPADKAAKPGDNADAAAGKTANGNADSGKPADKNADGKKPAGNDANPPGDSSDPKVFGK